MLVAALKPAGRTGEPRALGRDARDIERVPCVVCGDSDQCETSNTARITQDDRVSELMKIATIRDKTRESCSHDVKTRRSTVRGGMRARLAAASSVLFITRRNAHSPQCDIGIVPAGTQFAMPFAVPLLRIGLPPRHDQDKVRRLTSCGTTHRRRSRRRRCQCRPRRRRCGSSPSRPRMGSSCWPPSNSWCPSRRPTQRS